jgi:hypothetical protein
MKQVEEARRSLVVLEQGNRVKCAVLLNRINELEESSKKRD